MIFFFSTVLALSLGATAVSAAATTTFPSVAGSTSLSAPIAVSGSYDGKMYHYDRGSGACNGQAEGGDSDAVFLAEDGGTLKNVIVGADPAEGVHCLVSRTIQNDALAIKQSPRTSYVTGGGAQNAGDKIFQHNGGGALTVTDFYAYNFGKFYRSCENCDDDMHEGHVILEGVVAEEGSLLVGINSNYGDTATITDSCINGNDTGDEPGKIGSRADGTYCIYEESDITTC
ncbi:pectate lyase [Choiromyces venosus 120613-1]|uniref:Pectate lyase n=1 Tax=Choiromyces venosus 120613-1 TaxID=1336337 RepID=A0A3N4JVQ6_9PEZI|nr:pectate lyase [Choiromyces venosus 120613-1]